MPMIDELKQFWSESLFQKLIVIAVTGIVLCAPLLVYATIKEQEKWDIFKAEHQCKIVSRMEGDVFTTTGISSSGKMVTSVGRTSDKTAYKCNDGATYWRNE
jgi:hypothetical protein